MNSQMIPQIKKALEANNIEEISKVSKEENATPIFEFLVKMQQKTQKKYIYAKNTPKGTHDDRSLKKSTVKPTRKLN